MRIFLVTLYITWIHSLASAQIHSTVVSENGSPIAFATIGVEGKNIGTYSFEDGTFTLPVARLDSADLISIRHLRYHPLTVRPSEIGTTVVLKEKTMTLEEVVVTPRPIERIGLFKKKSASDFKIDVPFNGAEFGLHISLPNEPLMIRSFFVNVASKNISSFQLRVKIYTVHSTKPDSLFYQSEVYTFDPSSQIIEMTLEHPVEVHGDIFLSFEWLVDKKVAQKISSYFHMKKGIVDSLKSLHSGSVIIYNNKRAEIIDGDGAIASQFNLEKETVRKLKSIEEGIPQLKFKTTKNSGASYYRSFSIGRWYPYTQSLIAGIEISYLE